MFFKDVGARGDVKIGVEVIAKHCPRLPSLL